MHGSMNIKSVDIVSSVGFGRLRDHGSIHTRSKRFFHISEILKPFLGPTQTRSRCLPGVLSPDVKRTGLEGDQSPASSTEVKNEG